jgi:predicted phage terminase large subunit-like protein
LAGSEIAKSFGSKALRNTDLFEIVGHKGTYISAGVGGAITGMGFDYGIIDDPYKNRQEANSRAIRENIWEWFTSTFYTRQEKDAKLLLMMTRWHESDLAGHIKFMMDNDPDFEKWLILSYSAVAEQDIPARDIKAGDPLWPGKYNLQSLNNTKVMLGSYEWNALYQQHPSPLEGGIFNRGWWKYYRAADLPQKFDVIIQSWDMAFKGTDQSDYVVGGIWGKIGADRYLLDLVRGKMTFTDTIRAVKELSSRWPNVQAKVVEDKANGTAVIDTLKKEITGLIPFNPKGSKIERANAVSPMVESGNVYLPVYKPWTQDFVEELTSFPNGANDDQVDMFTQAMLRLDKHKGLRIMNKRSFNL